MNFTSVIIENLNKLTPQELVEIKNAIETHLSTDKFDKLITQLGKEFLILGEKKGDRLFGRLSLVKAIKDATGWGLKESKYYMDKLVPYKPEEYDFSQNRNINPNSPLLG